MISFKTWRQQELINYIATWYIKHKSFNKNIKNFFQFYFVF